MNLIAHRSIIASWLAVVLRRLMCSTAALKTSRSVDGSSSMSAGAIPKALSVNGFEVGRSTACESSYHEDCLPDSGSSPQGGADVSVHGATITGAPTLVDMAAPSSAPAVPPLTSVRTICTIRRRGRVLGTTGLSSAAIASAEHQTRTLSHRSLRMALRFWMSLSLHCSIPNPTISWWRARFSRPGGEEGRT